MSTQEHADLSAPSKHWLSDNSVITDLIERKQHVKLRLVRLLLTHRKDLDHALERSRTPQKTDF